MAEDVERILMLTWETIEDDMSRGLFTERAEAPGGWLVRTMDSRRRTDDPHLHMMVALDNRIATLRCKEGLTPEEAATLHNLLVERERRLSEVFVSNPSITFVPDADHLWRFDA